MNQDNGNQNNDENNNEGPMTFDMDAVINDEDTRDLPQRQDTPSVDTTFLASSVGSVVGPEKNGFLRSLCLPLTSDDTENPLRWDITFADTNKAPKKKSSSSKTSKILQRASIGRKSKNLVTIASIEGHAALSYVRVGDVVTRINGKKIGPSYNAQRCSDLINEAYLSNAAKNNGIISIQTGNDDAIDTILQATVLKPHQKATSKDLGLEVWWWRGLCVRSIDPNGLFAQSGLKVDDELESINQISLTYNEALSAKDFDQIVKHLPCEVTLVVKRSKHRVTGAFK